MSSQSNNYKNKYSNRFSNPFLRWLLNIPIVGVAVHWLFQGMLYMDKTELAFKIGLEIVLILICGLLFAEIFIWQIAWLISFLLIHTLNFLFNGQFWVLMKIYRLVDHSFEDFDQYTKELSARINAETCFRYAAIYGSVVRGEWKPTSDLDLRLVRDNGLMMGLRACLFVVKERSHALLNRFPLDVYILDNMDRLSLLRTDEEPYVLLDNQ